MFFSHERALETDKGKDPSVSFHPDNCVRPGISLPHEWALKINKENTIMKDASVPLHPHMNVPLESDKEHISVPLHLGSDQRP